MTKDVTISDIFDSEANQILTLYLEQLNLKYPDQYQRLRGFVYPEVEKNPNAAQEFRALDPEYQYEISSHMARIKDLQSKVINNINIKHSRAIDETKKDAGSFGYVLDRLIERGVTREEFQRIIARSFYCVTITAHPTNPYATDYTIASMQKFDAILGEPNSEDKINRIKAAISNLIDIQPIAAFTSKDFGKKSQADEFQEAAVWFTNMYHLVAKCKVDLESKTKGTPYEGIEIEELIRPYAWLAGDGDGNPNATDLSLRHNVENFRQEIIKLYLLDLDKIIALIEDEKLKNKIEQIKQHLNGQELDQEFILMALTEIEAEAFRMISQEQDLGKKSNIENARKEIALLTFKFKTFGLHFAKIDIRHDASDINCTTAEILFLYSGLPEDQKDGFIKEYNLKEPDQKAVFISDQLKQLDQLESLKPIDFSNLTSTTTRIIKRLQVVAEKSCSDKFVIAECKSQSDVLSALFLLRATGNPVTGPNSLNIVTLSETAEDLLALGDTIGKLLENEYYRKYVFDRLPEIIPFFFMVAKSDTRKRSGGGASYAQEQSIADVPQLLYELLKQDETKLKLLDLFVFIGGGYSLQRGSTREDEVINLVTKIIMNVFRKEYGLNHVPINVHLDFTVQGLSNANLHGSNNTTFMSRCYSQTVYSSAKMLGNLEEKEINDPGYDRAREYFEIFCRASESAYKSLVNTENGQSPIDQLLLGRLSLIAVTLANVASRPAARPATNSTTQTDPVFNREYFDGKKGTKKITGLRAITAVSFCNSASLRIIGWYGALHGIDAIINSAPEDREILPFVYKYKTFRDSFRSLAVELYMTNFDHTWNLLFGTSKPDKAELERLDQEYLTLQDYDQDDLSRDKRLLAHLEKEANQIARSIHYAITGQEAQEDFEYKDLLKKIWPEIAEEITNRKKHTNFSLEIYTELMTQVSRMNPKEPIPDELASLIRNFSTLSTISTPTLLSNSLTKPSQENPTYVQGKGLKLDDPERCYVVTTGFTKTQAQTFYPAAKKDLEATVVVK